MPCSAVRWHAGSFGYTVPAPSCPGTGTSVSPAAPDAPALQRATQRPGSGGEGGEQGGDDDGVSDDDDDDDEVSCRTGGLVSTALVMLAVGRCT